MATTQWRSSWSVLTGLNIHTPLAETEPPTDGPCNFEVELFTIIILHMTDNDILNLNYSQFIAYNLLYN